jgi:hypothetical protein
MANSAPSSEKKEEQREGALESITEGKESAAAIPEGDENSDGDEDVNDDDE